MLWVNVSQSAQTQITKYFLEQINRISLVPWDSLPIVDGTVNKTNCSTKTF